MFYLDLTYAKLYSKATKIQKNRQILSIKTIYTASYHMIWRKGLKLWCEMLLLLNSL